MGGTEARARLAWWAIARAEQGVERSRFVLEQIPPNVAELG